MGKKYEHRTQSQLQVLSTPDGFAQGFLGMKLYPKQQNALHALIPKGARVTFKSCNESGKTSRIITAAVLWHLTVYPKGTVKSTSGSWEQIETQLVPKLKGYSYLFPNWKFLENEIQTRNPNCFWRGISTRDPGRFEGAHEDEDSPLLIIVDEAKTVPDPIFEAIERCRPTRLLLASSPGAAEGEFYRSWTSRASFYTEHISVTAAECPHIPQKHIEEMEAKWGRDHPLVRSMIHAEFMQDVNDAVVSLAHIERVFNEPPPFKVNKERRAFCDFAAGGDENVLAIREGNRVKLVDCWRDKDTMAAVGRFIVNFKNEGLEAHQISGDADGLGKPMCDALTMAGWPIYQFRGGMPAMFDSHYANLWAEAWFEGAKQIERRQVILPNDVDLRGQLASRKRRFNNRGKLALETKEDMRKRGVPSPDRADAVLGAMMPEGFMSDSALNFPDEDEGWIEYANRQRGGVLVGADAGL